MKKVGSFSKTFVKTLVPKKSSEELFRTLRMGREVRRVPANWQHPKQIKEQLYRHGVVKLTERYRPMKQQDYNEAIEEHKKDVDDWFTGYKEWTNGFFWNSLNHTRMPKKEKLQELVKWILEERKKCNFPEDFRQEELMKYQTGICSWSDLNGEVPRSPNPEDYMPKGEWFQLFETISEGTPLTPAFQTSQELVGWLVGNKDYWGEEWTKEQAEAMTHEGCALTAAISDGVVYDSKESLLLPKKKKKTH